MGGVEGDCTTVYTGKIERYLDNYDDVENAMRYSSTRTADLGFKK